MPGDDDALCRLVGEAAAVRETFDQVPMMVAGLRGPEHRFVAVNAAVREFLDDSSGLLGRRVREVVADADGERLVALLNRVYATGEPESGASWRIQCGLAASGTRRERYVDLTATPHRVDGVIAGLLVHAWDVTERTPDGELSGERVPGAHRLQEQASDAFGALQEALLPAGLPVLPGVDIAGRYLAAEADQAAGGDWFDVIPLGGGRMALVVGDVVGHGLAATAVMGQLRAVFADQLAGGADLGAAVHRVRRYAERNPGARSATLCAVVLDPATGSVGYVTCGHPAPLLVSPRGGTRFLPASGDMPLGVGTAAPVAEATLGPEEVLLLYTDGLVERPSASLATGQAELAAAAGDIMAGDIMAGDMVAGEPLTVGAEASLAHQVCARTVEGVTGRGGLGDDVTVLAVQRRTVPLETFEQVMPARAGLLAMLRQGLEAWLRSLGASSEDLFSVQIAAVEAVTNSVEHAYPDGADGQVWVRGRLDDLGALELSVRDAGRWSPVDPDPGLRGRGLVLIRRHMHDVTVATTDQGTAVVMRRMLRTESIIGTPERVSAGLQVPPERQRVEFGFRTHLGGPGQRVQVRVFGPIDIATAPRLRAALNEAGRGGALPLTVDLDAVTHLASSGIQLLADLAAASGGQHRFSLVAEPGSIARHILDLTGFDHLVVVPRGR